MRDDSPGLKGGMGKVVQDDRGRSMSPTEAADNQARSAVKNGLNRTYL